MSQLENILTALDERSRSLYVDDEQGRTRLYQVTVDGLDDQITAIPELVTQINWLATMFGVSQWEIAAFHNSKPSRYMKRAESILSSLRHPEMLNRLKARLGTDRAHEVYLDIVAALLSDRPILTPAELAKAVAQKLNSHRLYAGPSPTGLLVHTLDQISNATGHEFSGAHYARQAK
ncbi:hypothetical protein Q6D67_20385 [Haliea sp. E1-2-M8]|uniref:hypothetical protein n=1 Tax=Haliea sp. E1-2-M8 TaxID=3064706 RepID=UPI002728CA60|nr:hypothetical protein [Haliea sp. E1-2-M8]MDO8864049.1 hypothetical protein [Haliea sp. E1-2-M8]